MRKGEKKINLKKVTISKLNNLHLIKGGSYDYTDPTYSECHIPTNAGNTGNIGNSKECPNTVPQSRSCERDLDSGTCAISQ